MNNLNFLKKSELLNIIAQELAYVAPVSWKRIVYYTERLPDLEIGLRNASISKCWVGVEEKLFDTSNGPALSISVELDDAIDELYKLSESMIYAELSGDFPLGDSRQPTYKSLRPFDLVS